ADFNFSDFDFSGVPSEDEEGHGFGGSFRDLFSQLFSRGGPREPEGPQRGADLEHRLHLGFWDAIRGTQVRVTVARDEACPKCHGTGAASGPAVQWKAWGGTGHVTRESEAVCFSECCTEV